MLTFRAHTKNSTKDQLPEIIAQVDKKSEEASSKKTRDKKLTGISGVLFWNVSTQPYGCEVRIWALCDPKD